MEERWIHEALRSGGTREELEETTATTSSEEIGGGRHVDGPAEPRAGIASGPAIDAFEDARGRVLGILCGLSLRAVSSSPGTWGLEQEQSPIL